MPADAAAYRALRLAGLAAHPEAFTSSFDEDAAKPLAATEARLAPDGDTALFGAFVDGALVGAVGLARDPRRKRRHAAEIVAMYVAATHGRRGIGRELLAHAIAAARAAGIEQLALTVTQGNDAARALYAAAGFATFGVEPRAIRVDGRYHAKEHMLLALRHD